MKVVRFAEAKMQDGWLCLKPKDYGDRIRANELCYSLKGIYAAEIKKHYEKRSLNANNLFWKGVDLIAEAINRDPWSVYLDMLKSYGSSTYVIVKPAAAEELKRDYRMVEELGEVTINGRKGVQLRCIRGSSEYNTKEMSRLIDGMLQELGQLEIEFLPQDDITRAINEWEQ